MHSDLKRLLRRGGGVVRGSSSPVRNAFRSGKLIRLFPTTYVDARLWADGLDVQRHDLRCVAALRYMDGQAVLSHTTALSVWRIGWHEPALQPVHVSVPSTVRLRSTSGLVVHRRMDFDHLGQTRSGGRPVTSLEAAMVDSWPLLPEIHRAGIVIAAVRRGYVTAADILDRLDRAHHVAGAAALRRLMGLVASGCHSPLELYGALHIFTGRGMPSLRRQIRVRVAGRSYYLDLFAEAEQVNFELDGAAFHGNAVQRESDLRRDAALATLGILVVRFSYARIMSEPDAVRREALAILASRRRS